MRRASFLNVLRGPDGRALALPLAILLLVGFVATGVASAAVSIDANGFVICGTEPAGDGSAAPGSGANHLNCCVSGCCPIILGLAVAALLALFPSQRDRRSIARGVFGTVRSDRLVPSARGPPFGLSHT